MFEQVYLEISAVEFIKRNSEKETKHERGIIFKEKFMNFDIFFGMKRGEINQTPITKIDLIANINDIDSRFEVTIKFTNNKDGYKYQWYLEGMLLVPIK
ncbi:UNKNOWN [Stylonychia lemnae]|uniref:Uncharacterized protein n=1 Tax=Stylonychia lemnae TaxID=5949 RepID=A0A078B6V1_STYLE|nr:UNKNOWN [Stylonychia lemnae]|eukprot:CDW90114.1 UNKNOWN [Stylonychia lemnae]